MYSFASNRPRNFGVYKVKAMEETEEVIAHYEHDLVDCIQFLNQDGITRMAQVMYLFKTKEYENIWWRIENRVHDLIETNEKLDSYSVS